MTEQATDVSVRKTITVRAPQDRAFRVFTEGMGSWWPLEGKSIGAAEPETAVVEPRAGGRWYERAVDGSECEWGSVVAYEPPDRIVLRWQIGAQWQYDRTLDTEVEVRFTALDDGSTRVDLEHRGLAAYGESAAPMHAIFDSPDGWAGILEAYAGRAVG